MLSKYTNMMPIALWPSITRPLCVLLLCFVFFAGSVYLSLLLSSGWLFVFSAFALLNLAIGLYPFKFCLEAGAKTLQAQGFCSEVMLHYDARIVVRLRRFLDRADVDDVKAEDQP